MAKIDLFIQFILTHYRVINDEDLIKLAHRFGITKEVAVQGMKQNGWGTEEGKEGWFSPNVKDRNSMVDKTDFKRNQIDDDYIDTPRW